MEKLLQSNSRLRIDASWQMALKSEFEQPYMQQLSQFLRKEKRAGKEVYPSGDSIFSAFNLTPIEQVKVVVIGQDPYHGPGQAHGLCFSVLPGTRLPPSLLNIYQEINQDLEGLPGTGQSLDKSRGCLTGWAKQGVLLLNSVLTVEKARAGSHQGKGWETFTDAVVKQLSQSRSGLVFLLWGSYAKKKGAVVDPNKHCVLTAPHPSPLSAHRGFLGCKHFSKTNDYLHGHGVSPIDWFAVE